MTSSCGILLLYFVQNNVFCLFLAMILFNWKTFTLIFQSDFYLISICSDSKFLFCFTIYAFLICFHFFVQDLNLRQFQFQLQAHVQNIQYKTKTKRKVDIFCDFISLNHELAKYGPQAGQNCLPPVFANKLLLEYKHSPLKKIISVLKTETQR